MGYDVWATGEWEIPADKGEAFAKALLEACAEKDGYGSYQEFYDAEQPIPDPGESPSAYFDSRFDENVIVEGFDDGSYKLAFADDSVRNTDYDQWIFVAAAPFADDEDTIYFSGEDDYKWTWVARGGKLVEEDSETVYGQDMHAPAAVQKIIEVIYPEHMDGKPVTAFFDYGDLEYMEVVQKIENIIREAGFGPQAGKSELERLADV